MAKKKSDDKAAKAASASPVPSSDPQKARAIAAAVRSATRKRVPRPRSQPGAAPTPDVAALRDAIEPQLQAMMTEVRSIRDLVQPPTKPRAARPGSGPRADLALESSVDSLRRLLSELIEQRMEAVVTDLVDIRDRAVALGGGDGTDLVGRLDDLLENLGAVRFAAEPMDIVDPLIHTVIDERHQTDAPDGVIVETVRPGFRTARGVVLCKAAVAVNRRV